MTTLTSSLSDWQLLGKNCTLHLKDYPFNVRNQTSLSLQVKIQKVKEASKENFWEIWAKDGKMEQSVTIPDNCERVTISKSLFSKDRSFEIEIEVPKFYSSLHMELWVTDYDYPPGSFDY
ncbi:MAG: hypothetical protein V4487_05265 [Chlamydiota bacterium]